MYGIIAQESCVPLCGTEGVQSMTTRIRVTEPRFGHRATSWKRETDERTSVDRVIVDAGN